MATQTLSRVGTAPTSARALFKSTPKSILKRPTPLPIQPSSPSPLPLSASFSIYFTPTTTSPSSLVASLKSPHVHFPPSPSLASTYTTHSPNTYDRAPIAVSPNPLALPSWGDRVYSPTLDGFKHANPPAPAHGSATFLMSLKSGFSPSPLRAEFDLGKLDDPRSPKPLPPVQINPPTRPSLLQPTVTTTTTTGELSNNPTPSTLVSRSQEIGKSNGNLTFAELPLASHMPILPLPKALTSYPRSPYPSAPLSPSDYDFFDGNSQGGFALRQKVTRRSQSLNDDKLWRPRKVNGDNKERLAVKAPIGMRTATPSPLRREFDDMNLLSPVEEGFASGDNATVLNSNISTNGMTKRKKPLPPPLPLDPPIIPTTLLSDKARPGHPFRSNTITNPNTTSSSTQIPEINIPVSGPSPDQQKSESASLSTAFWQSMSLGPSPHCTQREDCVTSYQRHGGVVYREPKLSNAELNLAASSVRRHPSPSVPSTASLPCSPSKGCDDTGITGAGSVAVDIQKEAGVASSQGQSTQHSHHQQKPIVEAPRGNGRVVEVDMVFATRDGVLWSPGLPRQMRTQLEKKPSAKEVWPFISGQNGCEKKMTSSSSPQFTSVMNPATMNEKFNSRLNLKVIEENNRPVEDIDLGGLMSPGRTTRFSGIRGPGMENARNLSATAKDDSKVMTTQKKFSRSVVASPSPNDPTAAFPSFSFALAGAQQVNAGLTSGSGGGTSAKNTSRVNAKTMDIATAVPAAHSSTSSASEGQSSIPFPPLKYPPRARLSMIAENEPHHLRQRV